MRIPTGPKQRENILRKLREAVVLQIALWDGLLLICEAIDRDHTWVSDHVCAMAITADSGMELSHEDLDDLLGIGAPGRVVNSKPLDASPGSPVAKVFRLLASLSGRAIETDTVTPTCRSGSSKLEQEN